MSSPQARCDGRHGGDGRCGWRDVTRRSLLVNLAKDLAAKAKITLTRTAETSGD